MAVTPYTQDTIVSRGTNGVYILSSGKTAMALSPESLQAGDRVMIVKDNTGKIFILAGKK